MNLALSCADAPHGGLIGRVDSLLVSMRSSSGKQFTRNAIGFPTLRVPKKECKQGCKHYSVLLAS